MASKFNPKITMPDFSKIDVGALLSGPQKRFILSIGDDGVVLTYFNGKKIKDAWIAAVDPETGMAELAEAFAMDKRAPVHILSDMLEQVYREEKVPKVSFFDRGKVLRRRLSMTFPNDRWYGALPQGQGPQGERFFLFAAQPTTGKLAEWVEAIDTTLPNKLSGMHLLPLESLEMLNQLAPPTTQKGVHWRILVTTNITGGYRQIISKQRRFILARMTAGAPIDAPFEEQAAAIERDIKASLAYVKRLGYTVGDTLDVVVINTTEMNDYLMARDWDAQRVLVMTPTEASDQLGLGPVGSPDSPYGDVLHAAWFNAQKKARIQLLARGKSQVDYLRLTEQLAPALSLLISLGTIGYMGDLTYQIFEQQQAVDIRAAQLKTIQAQLTSQQAKVLALPHSVAEMRQSLLIRDELEALNVELPTLSEGVSKALAVGGRVTLIEAELSKDSEAALVIREERRRAPRPGDKKETGPVYTMLLTIQFPSRINTPNDAIAFSDVVLASLKANLDGMEVRVETPAVNIRATQTLRGNVKYGAASDQQQVTYSAVFAVEKPSS